MNRDDTKALKRLIEAVELVTRIDKKFSDKTFLLFGTICSEPGVPQSGLDKRLDAGKNTISVHVDYLEKAGLVRADQVGNAHFLYPTAAGEALAEKMVGIASGAR